MKPCTPTPANPAHTTPARTGEILLCAATVQEMLAAVALLPGAKGLDLSLHAGGAVFTNAPPPLPELACPQPMQVSAPRTLRLLVCGVGPVASGISLARELALAASGAPGRGPYLGVLNIGYAGTYDTSLAPVGSLVLAEGECLPEYGVWPEPDEETPGESASAKAPNPDPRDPLRSGGPGLPAPLRFAQAIAGEPVFRHIPLRPEQALGNMGLTCHTDAWRDMRRGLVATVAGVSGTPLRAKRMARLGGALAEAMEGFSLALAAHSFALPFAEFRAVSNAAGRRPPDSWDIEAASAALGQGLARLCAAPPVTSTSCLA